MTEQDPGYKKTHWELPFNSATPDAPAELSWFSLEEGPIRVWTAVLQGPDIRDAFRQTRKPLRFLLPQAGVTTGFSSRAFGFDFHVIEEGRGSRRTLASALIFVPNELELLQVTPEPQKREVLAQHSLLTYSQYNSVHPYLSLRHANKKKVEDFLVVMLASLLGIGSAAAYQSGINLLTRRHASG